GATYMVLAPEHELVFRFSSDIANWKEVKKYIEKTKHKNQRDRTAAKIKTGIELKGIKAVNPANGKEIPVWIADYVLAGYGTGAIMAVPAHDERDFEFAQKFNLPIIQVIKPVISHQLSVVSLPYIGDGELINSGRFNGLSNLEAKDKIVKSLGVEKKIQYKIRDWVFSRQRYWGEPIPIIKCKNCGNVAVSEKDLPVKLPAVRKYEPTGRPESPLSDIAKWVNIKCPECGGSAKRETNTMPQWAGSSWYYLRYIDAKNKKYFVDSKKEHYWLPVDVYIGGVEHAVLHLLYARFWHKFLFDLGFVSGKEPFKKLVNQGLILGPDGQKMSKSRGNIVNPDAIVKEFGADSLRLYEMFMGPLEDQKPWDVKGIIGLFRFLTRVYKLMENAAFSEPRLWRGKLPPLASLAVGGKIEKTAIKNSVLERLLHQTIKKVTKDIESFKFNTAISALMILVNEMEKQESIVISYWSSVIKLLFPFAPHLAQELWQKLGNKTLLDKEKWPEWDEKLAAAETFELVIQINGKVRDKIEAPVGITEEEVRDMVIKMERVKIKLAGKEPKKIIYIRNRLVNLVV
ncbi:MAG: leucine--tRNA ligase, partial [Candidatus Brennerbacteria bacterium]|nr:leucine--tRNA ligase [Candidatus Brennerbacteria bacterium]